MLLPLLEGDEDDREDRSGIASASNNSSSASALRRHSSVGSAASSSRRRLRAEHERRLLRLLKDSCITTGSEVTDYEYGAHPHLPSSGSIDVYGVDDDDDDVNGDNDNDVDVGDYEGDVYHAPARKMKWTDFLRLFAVVVVTAAGVSSYLAAIVQTMLVSTVAATTTAATAASEWSLGAAGVTCLLTSTLVWRNEIRLNRAVSLRLGLRGLRHLARRLSRELKTLAREKEALISEVER